MFTEPNILDTITVKNAMKVARTATGIENSGTKLKTYKDIQLAVEDSHGFVPRTCWIAHCKELLGMPVRRAHNRIKEARTELCPIDKQPAILAALERSVA